MKQRGYRIPASAKPCKFGQHGFDSVPVPFGSGNCSMPYFECGYEGDKETIEVCEENAKCKAYEPCETVICGIHDIEYYLNGDWCEMCHPDAEEWS